MAKNRFIKFNGIEFGKGKEYIFTTFQPNECTTDRQEDKPILNDGSILSNFSYQARVVSLSGMIIADNRNELFEKMQKLSLKCNGKTISDLIYFNGAKTYKSTAVADVPQFGDIIAKRGVEYNINFTLPNFYWYGTSLISLGNVSNTSTGTSSTVTVNNPLDLEIKPIIYVFATGVDKYTLENTTTGAKFDIDIKTALDTNGYIVIDTDGITANDNNGNDLINNVGDIEEFYLQSGNNSIKISSTTAFRIELKYYPKYIGV